MMQNAIIHTATCYGRNTDCSDTKMIIESNILYPIELLEIACKYYVETFLNTDTYSVRMDL